MQTILAPTVSADAASPATAAGDCRSAEVALLCCLARLHLDGRQESELQAILRRPINWDTFVGLAARHHLLPLCCQHLLRHGASSVPASVLQGMHEDALRSARHSLQLAGELLGVLGMLQAAGVSAIGYKGPVLAQQIYGSIVLRDVLDLDILVARTDAVRSRQLLHERGYRDASPADVQWDAQLLTTECNLPLVHGSTHTIIELHWTPEPAVSERHLGELRQRLGNVRLGGVQVPTFARSDLLPLLCLHGCRHMWERLEWVTGVAEIVRAGDVPWGDVLQLAHSLRGTRALLVGLVLAHDLLGAPLPDHVLSQARADRRVRRLVSDAGQQMFRDERVLAHRLGVHFHAFQLRTREGIRERARYIGQRLLGRSRQYGRTRLVSVAARLT